MTHVRSRDNFKNLYVHYQYTWQGANLREEVQHANAQIVTGLSRISFFRLFWKDDLSKRITLEYDLSDIIQ